jgi:acyl CoA:acetate/3-ketoacid CoA transferase alpha subunit/acyl CoA:acetate/3-ketoacid CoA transferase beta subunit
MSRPSNAVDGAKVMPLADAVRTLVRPGQHLHLAYNDARPNAAVVEIARQFRGTTPRFTLSSAGISSTQNILIHERLVEHLITSFIGESFPSPSPSPIFRAALRNSELTLENWSLWSFVARLVGGALGFPFFPVHSLRDSDLETEHLGARYGLASTIFDGHTVSAGVVKSMRPDLVILQAVAADPDGNVVLAAPYGEAYWGSLAAREGVLVCVERIVDREVIRNSRSLLQVPGHVVRAICDTPMGSHPYGLFNPGVPGVASYSQDGDFIAGLRTAMRRPEQLAEWLEQWVYGVADHEDYLSRLGATTLAQLRGAATPDMWMLEDRPAADVTAMAADPNVQMVLGAARLIEAKVRDQSLDVILSGIGFANLASWTAAKALRESGVPVELMAEIGMYGFEPRPGDPFLFASRNLHASAQLTDVMRVLGTYVSGPGSRCLGVIGAGQVDQHGRVNTTKGDDGQHLFGSGGANDIASAAEDVLVTIKHSPDRMVAEVPYVTSPGGPVSTIVTTEAVLTRRDGEFELTSYFPRDGLDARERVAQICALTGWDLKVAAQVCVEPNPAAPDLTLLREYDPQGAFL